MRDPHSLASGPGQPVLIVTGLSGAGKTTALGALADGGYEIVDGVPLSLLGRLLRPDQGEATVAAHPLAIGVDVRTRDFSVEDLLRFIDERNAEASVNLRLVFLFCDEEDLRRRYTVTRRRHPLAATAPVSEGIALERQILAPLRERADVAIDTTGLSPSELKAILDGQFGLSVQGGLVIQVVSFSYRSGLPREADLVFDVRFLANPHYDPELKPLTGLDEAVGRHIAGDRMFKPFFDSLTRLLDPLLPRYSAEGKCYLTIAVGCTGGRHRSVFVAEELAQHLQALGGNVEVYHRDLTRSGALVPVAEAGAS
ncbi:MAG: RNase adapter RapZ [Rhodospirillales bacterium]|nr:RNase adapter RapZ [Rhodospirillales bacterium]